MHLLDTFMNNIRLPRPSSDSVRQLNLSSPGEEEEEEPHPTFKNLTGKHFALLVQRQKDLGSCQGEREAGPRIPLDVQHERTRWLDTRTECVKISLSGGVR